MGAFGRSYLQDRTSEPTRNEIIGGTESLRLSLISDQPGIVEFLGSSRVLVSLHVGTSVAVDCHRGGQRHRGTTIHGDLEIIPTQLGGVWEIKSRDTALVIGLKLRILERIVEESGVDPGKLRIINRFQVRDAQIEHIGWALKAEMESGYPSGRSYLDALATALAARIVRNHSSLARTARSVGSINMTTPRTVPANTYRTSTSLFSNVKFGTDSPDSAQGRTFMNDEYFCRGDD